MNYAWSAVLALALYLNVVATVQLWRSVAYDRRQKIRQTVLVWLLPFVGAAWVLTFLTENAHIPGHGVRPRSWLLQLFALSFFLSHASVADSTDSHSQDHGVDSGFIPSGGDGGSDGGIGGSDAGGGGDG
jgi:uncharacterized membrane protein YgcG